MREKKERKEKAANKKSKSQKKKPTDTSSEDELSEDDVNEDYQKVWSAKFVIHALFAGLHVMINLNGKVVRSVIIGVALPVLMTMASHWNFIVKFVFANL